MRVAKIVPSHRVLWIEPDGGLKVLARRSSRASFKEQIAEVVADRIVPRRECERALVCFFGGIACTTLLPNHAKKIMLDCVTRRGRHGALEQ